MKTILCFGDSNAWGQPPGSFGRHSWDVRWPGALQQLLGSGVRIIEEGLSGRTTCFDDPFTANRSGLQQLPVVLESHYPLDLVIIMLGTNDLKRSFNLKAFEIAHGLGVLLTVATQFEPKISEILLVSPPYIVETPDVDISRAVYRNRWN